MTNGGPAFPGEIEINGDRGPRISSSTGMSMLDYFAGQALVAIVHDYAGAGAAAKRCYEIAAAMLAERELRMKEK